LNTSDPQHRFRRIAIAVAAGGGLALGIAGLAQADDTPAAPSPSGSASAQAPAPGSEKGEPAKVGPGQRQHQPHLDGTVKSIADGRIMIVDREGFTRQINFTGTPDGVKVGVRIHAEGTVNADGVSLDATKVGLAPTPPNGPGPKGGPRGGPHDGTPPAPPAPSENGAPPAPSESGAPPAPSNSEAAPAPSPTS